MRLTEHEMRLAKLNELIAKEVHGWKWIAYWSRPVRGSPGYPEKCVVRLFVPPSLLADSRWVRFFDEAGGYTDANGTEPLDYCYCSSGGSPIPPSLTGPLRDVAKLVSHEKWQLVADAVIKEFPQLAPLAAAISAGNSSPHVP